MYFRIKNTLKNNRNYTPKQEKAKSPMNWSQTREVTTKAFLEFKLSSNNSEGANSPVQPIILQVAIEMDK